MKGYMYTIWDDIAKDSSPPFLAKNDDVAIRQLMTTLFKDELININDYNVYKIGLYDTETMYLTPCDREDILENYLESEVILNETTQ